MCEGEMVRQKHQSWRTFPPPPSFLLCPITKLCSAGVVSLFFRLFKGAEEILGSIPGCVFSYSSSLRFTFQVIEM